MNSTFKRVILGILIVFVTGACEDYLDKEPIDVIVAENFYTNEKEAFQGLIGIYDVLQRRNAMYDLGIWQLVDGPTDNLQGNTGNRQLADYAFDTTDNTLSNTWQALYDGIHRANLLLANIPNSDGLEPSVRARFEGEAKFLRALYYYHLVNLWGGVPLVDRVLPSDELAIAQASAAEIYAFIENDLRAAMSSLPAKSELSQGDFGRASKGAATALLAKVLLFQEKWPEAIATADVVITSGEYSLLDDYFQIFQEGMENNDEIIFAVAFSGDEGESQLMSQWMEPQGWGQSTPTSDLIEAFEPGDERMNASVITDGTFITEPDFKVRSADYILQDGESVSEDFVAKNGNVTFTQNWWGNKFWSREGWLNTIAPTENTIDIPVLRLADVVLIRAEALAETGDLPSAANELNKIRSRAGLSQVETVVDITNKTELTKQIYKDRRLEFVNEGTRLYDLRRWGTIIDALNAVEKQATAPRDLLFPIPQQQIDLHNGQLSQNPGWN